MIQVCCVSLDWALGALSLEAGDMRDSRVEGGGRKLPRLVLRQNLAIAAL